MIGLLIGIIVELNEDNLILNVNGVGYLVFCSSKILSQFKLNDHSSFLIDTQVREDNIQLIGFKSKEEQYIFRILKSVKGVSNKIALNILSALELDEISTAISTKQATLLTRASGVGKKLAERIITELQDKITSNIVISNNANNNIPKRNMDDAVSALINLGYSKIESNNAVNLIAKDFPDDNIEQIIKKSLKLLANY